MIGNIYKGAIHTPQTITWLDDDGTAWDLSESTITGKMIDSKTGSEARDIDGALALIGDGTGGQFTWEKGDNDAGTVGDFYLQFKATYVDETYDLSSIEKFKVLDII